MRFKCSQQNFLQALEVVNRVIDTNSTLPVLNNILLKAEGKRVFMSATNLEMVINYSFETDVKNEGSITVPAKLLSSYISLLKDEEIEVKLEEGVTIAVISESSKTKIKCIAAEEFPLVSQVDKEASFIIPTKDFMNAVSKTDFAAASNNTRPVLAGIYMHAAKKELKMVATDSYRLSEKIMGLNSSIKDELDVIIPVRAVTEVARIASKIEPDEIEINIGKNQVLFSIGEVDFISRLIEGKFPNYQQIIPKDTATSVEVDNEELTLAVKRLQLFAKENNNKIIFNIKKDGIELTTPVTQIGEEECKVEAKVDGPETIIALNAEFVLDVLSNVPNKVYLGLTDKITPAIFHGKDEKDYTHIIMPLKIQDI
jgi:DNA polymerase-3 subunit beta